MQIKENMNDELQLLTSGNKSVQIVLVNTSHSGNIGAAARAMKTMGLSRLCLVDPQDFPSDVATRRASGAHELLDTAKVSSTLEEAVAGSHLVVGASARNRTMEWPLVNPRECASIVCSALQQNSSDNQEISIVFGRESSGLTNAELQLCNYHVNIPANLEYSSLNLAMAVQVVCYELRMAFLDGPSEGLEKTEASDDSLATHSEVEGLIEHLQITLSEVGFYDPKNPRMLMSRLRRLFQRARMEKMEVNILRGSLKAILNSIEKGR